MSSEDKNTVGFFGRLSLKIKLIAGFIFGLLSFFTLFFISKKINARKILELELEKLETEIEIKHTNEDIAENKEEIKVLEKRAQKIKEEIALIDNGEKPEMITQEELDNFFDERGF